MSDTCTVTLDFFYIETGEDPGTILLVYDSKKFRERNFF